MKRMFKKVTVVLGIVCMGGMVSSCDEENGLGNIISAVLNNLFNPGETYSFTGTATTSSFSGALAQQGDDVVFMIDKYLNATDGNDEGTIQYSNVGLDLTCSQSTAQLTIPAIDENDGNVQTTEITIYNLVMDTKEGATYTTLDLGDSSSFSENANMTYNGVTYEASTMLIEKAQASQKKLELDITIYFRAKNETSYTKGIHFTYSGEATTAAQ